MKHLFVDFENSSDVFSIKRVCLNNDFLENSKKQIIGNYIKNFLNRKENSPFRFICMENYYSEISDERASIGMMDSDIMKIRMKNMVMRHREV